MRAALTTAVVLASVAVGCSGGRSGVRTVEVGRTSAPDLAADPDPTVRPARLSPERVDERVTYGAEGGGVRVIVSGLRLVSHPNGAVVAAEDRLPALPSSAVPLPERLGGGFLFVVGATLWRADRWLAPARPIFTSPQPITAIWPGLDRVYVRGTTMTLPIDARTGAVTDLGPWPPSPFVSSYAAADGWRAAAVADLRGVVATFDAGATWRSLELPIEAKQVVVANDSLAIGGLDGQRGEVWYELRGDGSLTRLGAAPRDVKTSLVAPAPVRGPRGAPPPPPAPPPPSPATDGEDRAATPLGRRPLVAAIEDGWPLRDGTALVARDGSLARVRLADGAVVELVREAFPLKTARCHPVSLAAAKSPGELGFVCGEPRGATVIYAYDARRGALAELRRFDRPRVVTSSGNGALTVAGPCAEDGEPTPPPRPAPARIEKSDAREGAPAKAKSGQETPAQATSALHPYCVYGQDRAWREVHVRGDMASERVVALADGRVAVLSPPQGARSPARLTVLDRAGTDGPPRATTVPIAFPVVPTDVGRVLRLGVWLEGFEERRPGVLGGWLEAGGTMLGIEVALDGKATVGQFIRDAGMPFVSGRYGLGWSASRRGFETTDGGMTWTSIDLPDPLVPAAKVERRACGPAGCIAYGWLRIGWGERKSEPTPPAPAPYRAFVPTELTRLELACEPLTPTPPTPRPPPRPAVITPADRVQLLGGIGSPPVLGSFHGLSTLPAFFSEAAPALRDSERGLSVDVHDLIDRYPVVGSLARVYGWGPKTGEWDTLGRWQVKWLSPFDAWPDVRSSLPSRPAPMIVDATRAVSAPAYGTYGIASNQFQFVPADDGAHGMLVVKRREVLLYELEADRAPVEVRRADGEPLTAPEGVVRAGGTWYLATAAADESGHATVVWRIDGGIARELARIPRVRGEAFANVRPRLARRSDGRGIAFVVEGQPTGARMANARWALPVDPASGALGEPEPLGYADLGDRTLEVCSDDLVGWVIEVSPPGPNVRVRLPRASGMLSSTFASLRLTSTRACVERLSGTYSSTAAEPLGHLTAPRSASRAGPPTLRPGELLVSVKAGGKTSESRLFLKCAGAPKPAR